tara:strand:- start:99 stop:893 length:795 start_codon:yes stop_codon:yes gene_type:complete
MIDTSSIWVVTDIDGTLMDHSYDLNPAMETINWLKDLNIPVIPCTSKTKAEVKLLRSELDIHDPFIVENGGAIYGEYSDEKSWEIILGKSYCELENILSQLSNDINYQLKPLNKLSDKEATELTGLKGNSLNLMRDRHWSMPFINPPDSLEKKINNFAKKYNVDIFRGNRMSHLLSNKSNKGLAIQKLIEHSKNLKVKIIGLGDSPNDLPLLEMSNYKIVIPGINGPNKRLLSSLSSSKVIVSDKPHGYGWKKEVTNLVNHLIL